MHNASGYLANSAIPLCAYQVEFGGAMLILFNYMSGGQEMCARYQKGGAEKGIAGIAAHYTYYRALPPFRY